MRRFLPLAALVLAACAKEAPKETATGAPPSASETTLPAESPEQLVKDMGVPMYPGSTAPDLMTHPPVKRASGDVHYELVLATADAPDKVTDWYAKQLDLPALPGPLGKQLIGKTKTGKDVIITAAPEAGRTIIRIKAIAYPSS